MICSIVMRILAPQIYYGIITNSYLTQPGGVLADRGMSRGLYGWYNVATFEDDTVMGSYATYFFDKVVR